MVMVVETVFYFVISVSFRKLKIKKMHPENLYSPARHRSGMRARQGRHARQAGLCPISK
jgi:hypothetical protein